MTTMAFSGYDILSPWRATTAICFGYGAQQPKQARTVGREPSQLTPSTNSQLMKQFPG